MKTTSWPNTTRRPSRQPRRRADRLTRNQAEQIRIPANAAVHRVEPDDWPDAAPGAPTVVLMTQGTGPKGRPYCHVLVCDEYLAEGLK